MSSIDVESPESVWAELEAAREQSRSYLGTFDDDVARLAGPAYRSGGSVVSHDPENHAFEFMALFNPQLVWGVPQFRISTARYGEPVVRARALTLAMNRWTRLTKMRECNETLASDFVLRYCIARIGTKVYPGSADYDDPPRLPFMSRVSPRDFAWDSSARTTSQCEFIAYRTRMGRKDLIKHAEQSPKEGWNLELLRNYQASNKSMDGSDTPVGDNTPQRDEVELWTMWFPRYELKDSPGADKGFHGTLVTVLGNFKSVVYPRDPRPFFGPREGPCVWGGAYYMSDHAAPLAPIQATAGQAEYVNECARAVIRSVKNYKRFLVTNSEKVAALIKQSPHDWVYHLDNQDVQAAIASIEVGGLTQHLMAAKEDARATLDRTSGIHDSQRGNVTGVGTATEVRAADQWSSARVGYMAQKFKDFLSRCGKSVAYYFDRDESVKIVLGNEASDQFADEAGPIDSAVFQGGLQRHESPEEFDQMDFSIEAFSVEQTTEQQLMQRQQAVAYVTQTLAQLAPTSPHIPWDEWLRMQSELTQQPDLERLLDIKALRTVQQMMLQAQQPIVAQSQPAAQPRLSSDVGKTAGASAPFKGGKGPSENAKAPGSGVKFEPVMPMQGPKQTAGAQKVGAA